MDANRKLEILKTCNLAQKNHWQLMCDLSSNDRNIRYFDGRESVNVNLNEYLEDNDNINDVLKFLIEYLDEYSDTQMKFVKENHYYNEYYKGVIDEINFLIYMIG